MAERISCFVMSGGVGSRLWPLSREDNPKQFHDLAGRRPAAEGVAKLRGWDGDADRLIAHGIAFMEKGRTGRGGWARVLHVDGAIADAREDAYDQGCVLLALAHAPPGRQSRRAAARPGDVCLS